jgi:rod shape-determining protein MreD
MSAHHDVIAQASGRIGPIIASFAFGLVAMVLPWSGVALALRPDFLLLALLFWALHRPSRVGLGVGFGLGVIADLLDGVVLGQHALAYVVGVYAVQYVRLRLLQFDPLRQTAQMLPVFLLVQFIVVLVGWLAAGPPAGIGVFLPALSGTLLWYVVAQGLVYWYGKNALSRR